MQLSNPVVYLIEDDEGSRKSTEYFLSIHEISTQCFESAEQFIAAGVASPFGCIVTDLILPGMSGMELFLKTRELGWTNPTIIKTAFGDVASVVRAFRNGIPDYLEKPFSAPRLVQSVNECLTLRKLALDFEKRQHDALRKLDRLSKRETKVLGLLAKGKSIKEISSEFGTSFQSVSATRKRAFEKLGFESEVLLVQWIQKYELPF